MHKLPKKYPNVRVEEFSSDVFEPCDIVDVCKLSDKTISIHKFEMSWLSNNMKNAGKFYTRYKTLVLCIILWLLYTVFCNFFLYI